MQIDPKQIDKLKALLSAPQQRIVILSHTNPDGDAIGSSLAWASVMHGLGHHVTVVVPNRPPYFLEWVEGIDKILNFKEHGELILPEVLKAELIFCLDFNLIARLEGLGETVSLNTSAKKILIDHHLSPPKEEFDLLFSHPEASSTCYLVYKLIEQSWGNKLINRQIGEYLYIGIMTDTGNFSFSALTPDLFRAVAVLVEMGVDIPKINSNIYNSFTEGRARLFGYVIDRKMQIIHNGEVAYMSLKESEMRRFEFQMGDSEGFVNYPLTIKKMKMSAMFLATRKFIRVSLRSRGDVDVNVFARKYFGGGGHKNASGGKSFKTMEETIEYYKQAVEEFFAEGGK